MWDGQGAHIAEGGAHRGMGQGQHTMLRKTATSNR